MDDFFDVLIGIVEVSLEITSFISDYAFNEDDKGYFRPDTLYNKFDAANKDYEKDVYRELKELRFRGVISKQEYKNLYEHQKVIDEKNKLIDDIKTRKFATPRQAVSGLNDYKKRIDKFYDRGYIADENYKKVCNYITEKLNEIERTWKV